jgi:hypothetical protein
MINNKLNPNINIILSDKTDRTDYFELIYECIETRNIFLNFIDLKIHNDIEPDIDQTILQALLNSNQKNLIY